MQDSQGRRFLRFLWFLADFIFADSVAQTVDIIDAYRRFEAESGPLIANLVARTTGFTAFPVDLEVVHPSSLDISFRFLPCVPDLHCTAIVGKSASAQRFH